MTLVFIHFPRFLSLLEKEINSGQSPIWDPDFKQNPPAHVAASASGGGGSRDGHCGEQREEETLGREGNRGGGEKKG